MHEHYIRQTPIPLLDEDAGDNDDNCHDLMNSWVTLSLETVTDFHIIYLGFKQFWQVHHFTFAWV